MLPYRAYLARLVPVVAVFQPIIELAQDHGRRRGVQFSTMDYTMVQGHWYSSPLELEYVEQFRQQYSQ